MICDPCCGSGLPFLIVSCNLFSRLLCACRFWSVCCVSWYVLNARSECENDSQTYVSLRSIVTARAWAQYNTIMKGGGHPHVNVHSEFKDQPIPTTFMHINKPCHNCTSQQCPNTMHVVCVEVTKLAPTELQLPRLTIARLCCESTVCTNKHWQLPTAVPPIV